MTTNAKVILNMMENPAVEEFQFKTFVKQTAQRILNTSIVEEIRNCATGIKNVLEGELRKDTRVIFKPKRIGPKIVIPPPPPAIPLRPDGLPYDPRLSTVPLRYRRSQRDIDEEGSLEQRRPPSNTFRFGPDGAWEKARDQYWQVARELRRKKINDINFRCY
jgi:hypothetical protein